MLPRVCSHLSLSLSLPLPLSLSLSLSLSNTQGGGISLAQVGPLPQFIVTIVFLIVYIITALVVFFDQISEVRLRTYSIVFWVILVLQQYINYALLVHHTASDYVSDLLINILIDRGVPINFEPKMESKCLIFLGARMQLSFEHFS